MNSRTPCYHASLNLPAAPTIFALRLPVMQRARGAIADVYSETNITVSWLALTSMLSESWTAHTGCRRYCWTKIGNHQSSKRLARRKSIGFARLFSPIKTQTFFSVMVASPKRHLTYPARGFVSAFSLRRARVYQFSRQRPTPSVHL